MNLHGNDEYIRNSINGIEGVYLRNEICERSMERKKIPQFCNKSEICLANVSLQKDIPEKKYILLNGCQN